MFIVVVGLFVVHTSQSRFFPPNVSLFRHCLCQFACTQYAILCILKHAHCTIWGA